MKKALVIRLGAFGDNVMITPLLRKLKEDGYHVTVNAKKHQADAVLKCNPNVDKILYHDDEIPASEYVSHWNEMAKGFDKVFNLSGSIEGELLKKEGTPEFHWSMEKRHGYCNVNYYDHTLEGCGYDEKGTNGELFFSPLEISEAKKLRKKYAGKFLILWSLSGSSFHKAYPYTEYVMNAMLQYDDVVIFAVGDALCDVFSPGLRHPRIKNYIDKWTMRKSMLMAKYVDCVVGTDTGLLVAAGCFETPKVILLSHTSQENLTKYWKNTTALQAGVECQPCHRLIFTLDACPTEPGIRAPLCMSRLPSRAVFKAINHYYKEKKNGHSLLGSKDVLPGRCDRGDVGQHLQEAAV